MALNAALEELVKTLPADLQAQQRAILEKQPALGEGWLRQQDYDRKMNEVKPKLDKYDETMDWYKRTKPVHDQTLADLKEAQEKAARLQTEVETKAAEIAAAQAAAGGGAADPEKIAKAVMEKMGSNIPTKAELATLIAAEAQKQAEAQRDKFFKEDVPATLAFMTGMNDVQWRYRDEFGKPLDKVEFSKFMTEQKISDPITAYDRFTEKAREEIKLAKAREEGKVEGKKEAQAEFVPGSTGASGPGHLQTRLTKKDPNDQLFRQDIELGDNSLANLAAAELRGEGRV